MRRRTTSSLPGSTRQSILLRKKMDARVISAFTRVFRRAMPAHDGAKILRRREFILALACAAAWPLAARAEQSGLPLVGFLHQGSAGANDKVVGAFLRGLQGAGYEDQRNVQLEFRWADGHYDRLGSLAADLVRLRPAVIAAALLPAAEAAKSATTTIPVVFISGSDPIETGLVASLGRPTSNVTGVSLFSVPLISKRLELLHELVPGGTAVAVLVNPSNPNARSNELEQIQVDFTHSLHA
jgi:ABC-type uncharacterized transport system substrate-binding protein